MNDQNLICCIIGAVLMGMLGVVVLDAKEAHDRYVYDQLAHDMAINYALCKGNGP